MNTHSIFRYGMLPFTVNVSISSTIVAQDNSGAFGVVRPIVLRHVFSGGSSAGLLKRYWINNMSSESRMALS